MNERPIEKYSRHCCDCGQVFTIAAGEVEFYKANNLKLPRRCEHCRKINKRQRDKYGDLRGISRRDEITVPRDTKGNKISRSADEFGGIYDYYPTSRTPDSHMAREELDRYDHVWKEEYQE